MTAGLVVLHSTEGSSLEGAVDTLIARNARSHEVWDVKGREMVNLVSLDKPARSLLNLRGGVETNNRKPHPVQIELVGYASRYSAGDREPVVPEFDDGDLRWLGTELRAFCARVGAPFKFPCRFKPYPSSYGRNGVRLSFADWLTVEGVIGHQHVPENSHGDPGALDVVRMAALSAPPAFYPPPTGSKGDDMHFVRTSDTGRFYAIKWRDDGVFVKRHLNAEWAGLGQPGNLLYTATQAEVDVFADA